MEYEKFIQPQDSYSDQFRVNHSFTLEVLKAISSQSIFLEYQKASLGHRDMLRNVAEEIEVLECRVSPDFSCSILYKLK